ncbi:MAG TPA: M20/M25/M40 family metallo-hydrolase [Steroidobacteraceae bacterium]|nr:M20/M25/M40 family metallo-hydrolase [Steroidobacteraceae bacterium]
MRAGYKARLPFTAAAAAILLAGSAAIEAAQPAALRAAVRSWRQAHERAIVTDFVTLLSMPNVATNVADVDRNAAWIEQQLRSRGFTTQLLRAAPGTPASVFAQRQVRGARRTVIFYAHYDGQPVGQRGWLTPPFEPVMRTALAGGQTVDWRAVAPPFDPEWRLFARSAGDDKASIEAMLAALDALEASHIRPTVNIKLLYEGEEEQGSTHFAALVAKNLDLLRGDLLIMGDGPMHQSGRQMVNFGNRGFIGLTLSVYGATRPLHDGHYGSWAPSPAVSIAHLIASLRDDDGHILIPHFYDDVAPVSAADRAALAAMPPVEADLKRALGLARNVGPARLADGYLAPTLNVRAIHVGDEGLAAANAIATHADASLDFRLAPGETPQHTRELLEQYLTSQGWFIVRADPDLETRLAHGRIVKVVWDEGGAIATKTPLELAASRAVVASIGRTVGYSPIELPIVGASSGMADIVGQLEVPMAGVSIANYDDNQHAENENLRLGNLWDGIEVYAGLLADLNW